jgi:hypothetical protein
VTSNAHSAAAHSASRKSERSWKRECNGQCYCREFHGSLLSCQIRENRNVAIKFFFSAIESFDLSVVGFCTSQPDDDPFAQLGKLAGISSEFF